MEAVAGLFWTNVDEMVEDIEGMTDYDVISIEEEYIEVIDRNSSDDRVEEYQLVRAGRTIAIRF